MISIVDMRKGKLMGKLIDQQVAIDAVDSETVSTNPEHFKSSEKFIKFMDDADIASFGKWQWANGFNTAVVAAKIQLEKLPSAQSQRKKGRWLPDNNCYYKTRYMCSECKLPFHVDTIMMKPSWRFCPNCGARMDGENE